jgi:uncharacterized protein with GYD domain
MPKYLLDASYTPAGVKGLAAHGGSARAAVVREAVESVGGTLESFYFAFGSTDTYTVADLPDNTAAAALALAITTTGALTLRTVVLLTPEEIDAAAQATVAYTPPSG